MVKRTMKDEREMKRMIGSKRMVKKLMEDEKEIKE
jgi:hypothetical protein